MLQATKDKIGKAFKDKSLSQEHKDKIGKSNSIALKGRHLSQKTKDKISKAMHDVTSGENNHFFGKHHSDATKEKMSEAHKGKVFWNNGIVNKRAKECPGPEWKRGIMK